MLLHMRLIFLVIVSLLWNFLAFSEASEFCNIERVPIDQLKTRFRKGDFPPLPLIYQWGQEDKHTELKRQMSREHILETHGQTPVSLSSSNTFSHGLLETTLEDYILTSVDISDQLANETFYLFGNNYKGIWKEWADLYSVPPCRDCDAAGARAIGIGGEQSGVSFHFHALRFSEVLIGKKQWFLFPPELTRVVNKIGANTTVAKWVATDYQRITSSPHFEGTLRSKHHGLNYEKEEEAAAAEVAVVELEERNIHNEIEEIPCTGDYLCTAGTCSSSSSSSIPTTGIRDIESSENVADGLLSEQDIALLKGNLYECVIEPNELLYFPDMWMHATLNLDKYNVFLSVFLDPQLMAEQ